MKLQRFNEHSIISDEKHIEFNNNEIKYLTDTANFMKDKKGKFLVNYKEVIKLPTGDYYLVKDKIAFTTIQSLVKYTKEFIEPAKIWFDDILSNLEVKTEKNKVLYYYDNFLFAELNSRDKYITVSFNFIKVLTNNYNLSKDEVWPFMEDRFYKIIGYDRRNISFL